MLRRTPMPRATKPLRRLAALVAKTPLKRATPKTRYRRTGPTASVVTLVLKRSEGRCEKCSTELSGERGTGWHIHHRRPRRTGGSRLADTNSPANLLALCPDCHSIVESYRADSYAHGWLLHAADTPAAEPVLLARGSHWTYLNDAGRYVDKPPAVA